MACNKKDNLTVKVRLFYIIIKVSKCGYKYNDYQGGEGFCCSQGENQLREGGQRSARVAQNENPELYQYYYHADHLGSSSYITNLDGEVAQHIEYVPFGEVFIEERNNTWNTPYLFNGKELDEETGLYYYGARYYNPRVSQWLSVDPKMITGEYLAGGGNSDGVFNPFNLGIYTYTFNRPVNYKDPDGRDPITGVADAMAAFGISVGMDILSGMVLEGKTFDQSLESVGWWSAGWEATKSYAISSVSVSGVATAMKLDKIRKSKVGKIVAGLVEKMTLKALDNYSNGKYNDTSGEFNFDKITSSEMSELFTESLVETLIEESLGSRAGEVLDNLKKENKVLHKKLSKLYNKTQNGEPTKRINNYRKVVEQQFEKTESLSKQYMMESVSEKVVTGAASKAGVAATKEE